MRDAPIWSRRHALPQGLAGGFTAAVTRVVARAIRRLRDHGGSVCAVDRVRVLVQRVEAVTAYRVSARKKNYVRALRYIFGTYS